MCRHILTHTVTKQRQAFQTITVQKCISCNPSGYDISDKAANCFSTLSLEPQPDPDCLNYGLSLVPT